MKITSKQVEAYINSKENAWSEATKRSERSRLLANLDSINKGPMELAKLAVGKYTLKTLFIRAGELVEFLGHKNNSFKGYLKTNALLFKNAYVKKVVEVSYEEAIERIANIKREDVREVALGILRSGMRAHEALKYTGSGQVSGKGSKVRDVFISEDLAKHGVSYGQLSYELKKVGLCAHDLRKLTATRLAERGAQAADLLAIMGWESIETAGLYLQAKNKERLTALINGA